MKQVIIHSEAEAELAASVDFYEERKPGLGLDFERSIRNAVGSIQKSPEHFPKTTYGTRRLVMRNFPFAIHYFDLKAHIWIVAFSHSSRKPGYWKDRLPSLF